MADNCCFPRCLPEAMLVKMEGFLRYVLVGQVPLLRDGLLVERTKI